MKNLKLALTAILTLAIVSLASADGFTVKPKSVKISLEKAIQNPGLVKAMYLQLDKSLLNGNNNTSVIVGEVLYMGTIYYISGTYEQWVKFFKLGWKIKSEVNHNIFGTR